MTTAETRKPYVPEVTAEVRAHFDRREKRLAELDPEKTSSCDYSHYDEAAADFGEHAEELLDRLLVASEQLTDALYTLAAAMDGFDIGSDVFQQLTCSEVNALAEPLRLVGRGCVADRVIAWHAEGDDEDDEHYGVTFGGAQ